MPRKTSHEVAKEREEYRTKIGFKPDLQQERVYEWVYEYLHDSNQEDWSVRQCQRFVNFVWHSYFGSGAVPPHVHTGIGSQVASGGRVCLTLPYWARNRNVVIHELGHAVLQYIKCRNLSDPAHPNFYLRRYEGHGPEFVRILIELHHEFNDLPLASMLLSAQKNHLRVARGGKWLPVRRLRRGNNSKPGTLDKQRWLRELPPRRGDVTIRHACQGRGESKNHCNGNDLACAMPRMV